MAEAPTWKKRFLVGLIALGVMFAVVFVKESSPKRPVESVALPPRDRATSPDVGVIGSAVRTDELDRLLVREDDESILAEAMERVRMSRGYLEARARGKIRQETLDRWMSYEVKVVKNLRRTTNRVVELARTAEYGPEIASRTIADLQTYDESAFHHAPFTDQKICAKLFRYHEEVKARSGPQDALERAAEKARKNLEDEKDR